MAGREGPRARSQVVIGGRQVRPAALVSAVVVVVAVFLVGGYLAVGLFDSGGQSNKLVSFKQVAGPSQTNSYYPGATVTSPEPKPDITLTDTSGQAYDVPARTRGHVTLLYFGYTNCPNLCPVNMALTADAIRGLPAKDRSKVTLDFVTIDPHRDTLPVLRAWLDKFDPAFVGLRGTTAQVHQAESDVGQPLSFVEGSATGDYQFEHAGYVLAYSPDGTSQLQFDISENVADYTTSLLHLIEHGYRS